jgi:tRNA isopentenyl-2-thiomethyl-A-37 hydroxylase MiaE
MAVATYWTGHIPVPKGQQNLAQRFSAGKAQKRVPEPRRGDTLVFLMRVRNPSVVISSSNLVVGYYCDAISCYRFTWKQ